MSAQGPAPNVTRDLELLAPRFRAAVEAAVAECLAAGLDVVVFETYRSPELQAEYFTRGRTKKPPQRPVTNAKSNLYSWHGYGLAVDVISKAHGWFNPDAIATLRQPTDATPELRARIATQRRLYVAKGEVWFQEVAVVFKRHELKWGGDWKTRDIPHFQWGRCKPSPSDRARELFAEDGFERVWEEVRAA